MYRTADHEFKQPPGNGSRSDEISSGSLFIFAAQTAAWQALTSMLYYILLTHLTQSTEKEKPLTTKEHKGPQRKS